MPVSNMKFSEMQYTRLDKKELICAYENITEKLKNADNYNDARAAFLAKDNLDRKVDTQTNLADIRHSINTNDEFYENETRYWNEVTPEIEEYRQKWIDVFLTSRFRSQFSNEYGDLMFLNGEISRKCFSSEIIPELQAENQLIQEYDNLIASAQIPFNGEKLTIAQIGKWKTSVDDTLRLYAWKAEGNWYHEHKTELDQLYDRLTVLRDRMARKLGYGSYTELGYYRMGRNCYSRKDVEQYRKAVVEYLVPLADRIFREQATRLGKEYPMSFSDAAIQFSTGNPCPVGSAEDILNMGQKFYDELSPETGSFYRMMRESDLMDVLATEGKSGGGYCTSIPDYGVPFIFANFNGTQHDVEVVTHEAGHAFAAYMNRDRVPLSLVWPSMEGCEVHSMSMEFFAETWADGFFGKDGDKFRYSHLTDALTFIPYGTMVDHFQHIIYDNPDMTPEMRHKEWKRLLGIYMPWLRLDGDIPFYADGEGWQRQMHIYQAPFYYIDYCLAQTVALQFWVMIQHDRGSAWECYMKYTMQGGSRVFTELLKHAGLRSPFEGSCLQNVCAEAERWLKQQDTGGW